MESLLLSLLLFAHDYCEKSENLTSAFHIFFPHKQTNVIMFVTYIYAWISKQLL